VFIEFKVTKNKNPLLLDSQVLHMAEAEIKNWAQVNEIPYTCKYYKNTFRVAFDDNRYYTAFQLTWAIDLPQIEYQLIDRRW
jgi:hypothetical protein